MSKIQEDLNKNSFFGKHKFIIFIILLVISILGFVITNTYLLKSVDKNSYVLLINGNAKLNQDLLVKDIKEKLDVGDTVRTIGENSLVVLEWGDGSITRLGGDSEVLIDELYLSKNNTEIQIGFKLLSGKSWSNVISFLGEGSYFKEYFRDSEAAVRGTVFNLDLSKEYLSVLDHKLNITKSDGEIIEVNENKPISLLSFDFINIDEFINKVKDLEWEDVNIVNDNKYLSSLKQQIHGDLNDLINIKDLNIETILANEEEKDKLYYHILEDYQKLNFSGPEDITLFGKKLELKEMLLKLASNENKQRLAVTTVYDLEEVVESGNFDSLNKILTIMTDNKDFIPKLDFQKIFKNGIIPEDIKNSLMNEHEKLQEIFGETFEEKMLHPLDTVKNIEEKGTQVIHNALDSGYEKVKDFINK